MRIVLLLILLISCPSTFTAQSLPEWYRVYTFDESIIEMSTSLVTLISKDVSRVRFRWVFDQPQSLHGVTESKYNTLLEVMELNCSQNQYRPYHLTFFDSTKHIVHIQDSPGEWGSVIAGSMMEKLLIAACKLIKKQNPSPGPTVDQVKIEKAARFAYNLARELETTKDFKSVIDKFFEANYLDGYLRDKRTNWFLNLNRDTAAKLSRHELQRFYVALMNAGYLSSLYLISQLPSDSDESGLPEQLLPNDILRLLRNHPYAVRYKTREGNYDFLGENIDSVERLRSYTDLLERIGSLLRKHVRNVAAEHSKQYQSMLEHWNLYQPRVRVCDNCLGLPNGTKIFEVNVPVFNLQLAQIGGELKVVSAMSRFK